MGSWFENLRYPKNIWLVTPQCVHVRYDYKNYDFALPPGSPYRRSDLVETCSVHYALVLYCRSHQHAIIYNIILFKLNA